MRGKSPVASLSPAALRSDWVGLERSIGLFRDPSNAGHRFIPLLLANVLGDGSVLVLQQSAAAWLTNNSFSGVASVRATQAVITAANVSTLAVVSNGTRARSRE